MAFGQQRCAARAAQRRQGAEPVGGGEQAILQHLRVARAGHAVGQHPGPGQAGPVGFQAMHDGPQRASHGAGIDHGEHGHAGALGQVGHAVAAVKQAHHALDQEKVRLLRGGVQACSAVIPAGHPQVKVLHRRTAGELVPVGVEVVWPALEHAHAAALARVQARQRSGDGGFALARSASSNQQGRTSGRTGGRSGHGTEKMLLNK